MKKWAFTIFAIFLGYSLLHAQDLVQAAKKEKERRERLKKTSTIIVTNADLYKIEREGRASIKITPPEEQSQDVRQPIPAPRQIQRTIPSQQIDNIDQIDLSVDKVEQLDQNVATGLSRDYATRIISTSETVQNPQFALDKPDGKYAELGEFGSIDLEIDIKNRSGDDIAIYAHRKETGIQLSTMNYGVFVEYQGEWEFIGFGGGNTSPETFDLGDIQSTTKIRLMFKDFSQSMWTARPYRHGEDDYAMGIDAVKSLHR
jgi:hypothetical protein